MLAATAASVGAAPQPPMFVFRRLRSFVRFAVRVSDTIFLVCFVSFAIRLGSNPLLANPVNVV